MTTSNLRTPILDGGIRSVNFFNGRLLSGEDLSQDWEANREARRRLGLAIGDGVAFGLEVSETAGGSPPTSPTVTVTKGLAVNRQGQTLVLTEDTNVSLVRPASGSPAVATTFNECEPTQPGVYVAGAGVYLLTIAPATGGEGRAPVSGLSNITATCNTRYTTEGVQFRLLSLNLTLAELSDTSHLRNRVAYKCFGVNDSRVNSFLSNPFGPRVEKYGLLDDLRPDCLTDCDVPLAVIYWTAAGIQFIDMWSVRRRVTKPDADDDWFLLTSDRRVSEGEAMFSQFQDQIEEMRVNETNLSAIAATDRFQYLPPAGLLALNDAQMGAGFNYATFFQQLPYHPPVLITGAIVEPLIRTALSYPPISLQNGDPLWLYQSVDAMTIRPYLIFTSAYVPYRGEARFDIARWNYSNFT